MLKFFCTCGHSRGSHAESTQPKSQVGGCHSCKCCKYYSDGKRNKNTSNQYAKLGLRTILPPVATLILSILLIGEIDNVFSGLGEIFFIIAFFVTFLYFAIQKPLDKLSKKILSR